MQARAEAIAAREVGADELGEIPQGLKAGLPSFHMPAIDFGNAEAMKAILLLGLTLASIGLVESLMTLSLIDELTETRGSSTANASARGPRTSLPASSAAWAAAR